MSAGPIYPNGRGSSIWSRLGALCEFLAKAAQQAMEDILHAAAADEA